MADEPVKVATLDNEVQARLLDAMLAERGIPHAIQSYYSRAYDGIFQLSAGWGHVEAPPGYRDEILAALRELDQSAAPPEDESGQE